MYYKYIFRHLITFDQKVFQNKFLKLLCMHAIGANMCSITKFSVNIQKPISVFLIDDVHKLWHHVRPNKHVNEWRKFFMNQNTSFLCYWIIYHWAFNIFRYCYCRSIRKKSHKMQIIRVFCATDSFCFTICTLDEWVRSMSKLLIFLNCNVPHSYLSFKKL